MAQQRLRVHFALVSVHFCRKPVAVVLRCQATSSVVLTDFGLQMSVLTPVDVCGVDALCGVDSQDWARDRSQAVSDVKASLPMRLLA